MKVVFVHAAVIRDGSSDVASARLRALLPAAELRRLGHHAEVVTVGDAAEADDLSGRLERYDRLVVSKSFDVAVEGLLTAARRNGLGTVFDVCDDHFDEPMLGPHHKNLAADAGKIVANSSAMADIVLRHTGRASTVINDPMEGPRGDPRASEPGTRERPLRLLWFGHPSNLATLQPLLLGLRRFRQTVVLHLVTADLPEIHGLVSAMNAAVGGRLRLAFTPWSPPALAAALEGCDMVVIPAPDQPGLRAGRSANRLVEALWAGRFVVAQPVPAYLPFTEEAWIGEDLLAGIEWAVGNPAAVVERLAAAQHRLPDLFSAEAVGRAWASLLSA